MSSSLINTLLVVGVLGGAALAFIKRCEWFQLCGAQDPFNDIGQQLQSTVSQITDQAKQQLADNQDEHKVAKAITDSGDAKRISDAIKVSQTPLPPKSTLSTDTPGVTVKQLVPLVAEPCHFSQACSALVRIWRGSGKDPCIPCGATAKYARANLAQLTLYGGRMSYN